MKILLMFLMLLLSINCNVDLNQISINKKNIEKLSSGDFIIPSKYGYLMLFVSLDNNNRTCTDINFLYLVFKENYKKRFSNFSSFLTAALNQRLKFSRADFGKRILEFEVDRGILEKANNLELFTKLYAVKINSNKYSITKMLSNRAFYTVLYCYFINDFQVSLNDYSGKYTVNNSLL